MSDQPKRIIYVAEVSYDFHRIASVEVVKETEKTFTVDRKTEKSFSDASMYISKRLSKTAFHIFDTLIEAQQYCIDELVKRMNFYSSEMQKMQLVIDVLDMDIQETKQRS